MSAQMFCHCDQCQPDMRLVAALTAAHADAVARARRLQEQSRQIQERTGIVIRFPSERTKYLGEL